MTLRLKNFAAIKNVIYLFLIFTITVNAVTVKTKVKHKITPEFEIKKQLSAQEIDPNISPNPVPINDDTVVVANEPPTTIIENHNDNSNNIVDIENSDTTTIKTTVSEQTPSLNQDDAPPLQKFCECSDIECNCCRDFKIPIVPVRGPGCAKIKYLGDQKMSVSIKYGDITLATRVISGKKAQPICVPLPGGFSSFCGRIYGLTKERNDFKACLSLELRAEDEIEAALRVSCFKFGSKGLQLSEAEPLPAPPENEKDEDDYDFFGLGGSDDDDDDDTDNAGGQSEEADYDGFSLLGGDLLDGLFGGGSSRRRNL